MGLRREQDPQVLWALSGTTQTQKEQDPSRRRRVPVKDVAWFLDQMATTQGAGVPLFRALGMVARMRKGTALGDRIERLQQEISEGSTLAAAMRLDERTWSSMVCALVAAGEASGSLDAAFGRAAELLGSRLALRRKIVSAMTYPILVMVITVVLVATLLIVVVPRFKDIYASLGSDLPWLTQTIVNASGNAPYVLAVLLALVGVGFLVLRRARTDEALAMRLDRFKLRVPVLGDLLAKGVNARVASTIASLLSAGVPLLEALSYAAQAAGSAPHRASLLRVRTALADGVSFSAALDAEGLWPDLLVQLVIVGEEAGSLPEMMERYSARSLEEVDAAATGLTKLIEPMLMVVIGVVVGVFLLALYLPIFNLGSQLR